jgi:hypothetical protein
MLGDGAAEPAGEDAREFGAPLVGVHATRVTPVVRFDVVGVIHGHHGDPAKRGPSVMSYDVFGRVLRKVMTRGSTGTGRVASRWRIWGTLHTPPRERRQRVPTDSRRGPTRAIHSTNMLQVSDSAETCATLRTCSPVWCRGQFIAA